MAKTEYLNVDTQHKYRSKTPNILDK